MNFNEMFIIITLNYSHLLHWLKELNYFHYNINQRLSFIMVMLAMFIKLYMFRLLQRFFKKQLFLEKHKPLLL